MTKAWRILIAVTVLACAVSCSEAKTTEVVSTSQISDVGEQSPNLSKYTEISFQQIPDSINDEYTNDAIDISIIGYLSDSVSNDKSTAYLFNSGYGTTPEETTVGKCVVLDLSNTTLGDNVTGDSFVKVTGSIIKEDWVDIYNTKSSWHLKVDKVETLIQLPDNVQQYQEYMESDEFEAFAKMIDFVGNAVYTWYNDDSIVKLDLEDIGCNTAELSKNTEEKYPELYNVIKTYEANLISYYEDITEFISKGERPEDIQKYYDGLYKNYSELSNSLVEFGMINNGG